MYNFKSLIKTAAIASLLALPVVSFPAAHANEIADWQGKVSKVVAKKQVYPRSAMRQEIEGRAKIKISINRTGEIQNFEIVEKTGHDVLDEEVPKLVERLNPLPTPPKSMTDEQLSFILPVSWRLQ